ncbi:MAG: ferrous iron transport protein B [Bacteroidales bacterium]|nr:ferrous iron transport protein B [Bacteroidales bacterium]
MKLSELHNGESAVIVKVSGHGGFRKRIMEMGFVRGRKVTSVINAPLNDPIKYTIMGYDVLLRRSEANLIEVLPEEEANAVLTAEDAKAPDFFACTDCDSCGLTCGVKKRNKTTQRNIINIAFVGNPNSGKTSLFNALSGGHEHVGNYSGVTVDVKTGHFNYKGYHFNITDLPGTYSLSAYSPEEIFVRRNLLESMPDVIVNVVVASNLERNLYLTTELIDLSQRVVVALNMYDELEATGAKLDYQNLGSMIGIPMVPTVAKTGKGLDKLLDTIIDMFEGDNKSARHVHINYGTILEPEITKLADILHESEDFPQQFPARYWAIKMMEGDKEVVNLLKTSKSYDKLEKQAVISSEEVKKQLDIDAETAISDAKYGFVSGALHETFTEGNIDANKKTRRLDKLIVNKWLGFPLFILVMWLMFSVTFWLGAYPQEWIATGFDALGSYLNGIMPDGAWRSMIVDGIIGGVGAVAEFLPNIILLYMFISLMEDSGYMSRAAFLMDKMMHKMGLHGKSFIPMVMGFGCNVPAIMATRSIESRSSRLITILVVPFMSCSARLPVYLLLAGAFFPNYAATIMIGLYLLGIVVAVLTAKLLRLTAFKQDETPFVMELPPYRWPTLRATLKHIWEKCYQYIKKIGTVILLASVIIWVLSYFPHKDIPDTNIAQNETEIDANAAAAELQYEQSYLGMIGKFIEPVMSPMGFDWKISVAVLSSIPAKEIVVSTLGVLYGSEEDNLGESLQKSGDLNNASALALMVFMLLFFPCIATIGAVASETKKIKWALFSVFYNTAVAWIAAYAIYLIASLF